MTFDGFFDQLGNLDWLAVILGTVAAFALSWVWYSPLFGKAWSKGTGVSMDSPEADKMIKQVALLFVLNIGLGYWTFAELTIENAIVMGLLFGLLLIAPALYSGTVWAGRNVTVFMIDAGYWIVAIAVAAFVQGLIL